MKTWLRFLIIGGLWLAASPLRADHLVGGDLTMTHLGQPGLFRVTMKQYWNEDNNQGDYTNDAQQEIFVFSRQGGTFMNSIILKQVSKQPVVYQNPACAKANRLRTVEVRFESTFQFDSRYTDASGYYMVWERCCRNGSILNIKDPGQTGFVLYLEFPALTQIPNNSSPEFAPAGGDYVCLGQYTLLNFGATDPNGDVLTYRLVPPWAGYTTPTQKRGSVISRSPYPTITWQPGFGDNNVIPGPTPLQLDANTGQLSLIAGQTGLFAFAIEITESRGGRVIGLTRREFQLLVVDCRKTALDPPIVAQKGQPVQRVALCPNDSVTLSVPASVSFSYQWQRDNTNLPGATGPLLSTKTPGVYTVVKSAAGSCARDTVSSPVSVSVASTTVVFDSIPPICSPMAGPVSLKATPPGGQFSGNGIQAQRFDPGVAGVGSYVLTYAYTNPGGCSFTATRTAVVLPAIQLSVPGDVSIRRGDGVRLAASANVPLSSILWQPPDGLNDSRLLSPVASPETSQTYTLGVTTPVGCTATALVRVNVRTDVSIPTAFSPNGDGLNDRWELPGISAYPTCEITIFNRWGAVLFHSVGYQQPWDGMVEGTPTGPGVYTYQIRLNDGQISYQGSLTVLP